MNLVKSLVSRVQTQLDWRIARIDVKLRTRSFRKEYVLKSEHTIRKVVRCIPLFIESKLAHYAVCGALVERPF